MRRAQAASRLAALRAELVSATTVAQCVPALGGLIDLAGELRRNGGERTPDDSRVLDEVLSYLRAARDSLAAPGEAGQADEHEAALLSLEAEACLLRDATAGPVSDLDNAVLCLRRLLALLPGDSDERAEAEAGLASATLTRAGRPGGRLADLDEAGLLLGGLLDRTPPGDPGRRQFARSLAVQRGLRFVSFGGTKEDRVAGIGYAWECLTPPSGGPPDETAAVGHLMIAWLTLTRQLTADQRSAAFLKTEVESSRHDGAAAVTLMERLGGFVIAPDDARAALSHLRQVPAELADAEMRSARSMLSAMALLVTRGEESDGSAADADDLLHVADDLQRAAAQEPSDTAELLAARAALLALRARASGDAVPGDQANQALHDAAARLPAGHPVRAASLSLLTTGLKDRVRRAGGADDPVAELDEVIRALDRMSPDDPEFARLIATVSGAALRLGVTRRSVAADDRIAAQLDRGAAGLAPDDPLRALAEIMSLGSAGLRGALRQNRDAVSQMIAELYEKASSYPAGDPRRTLAQASLGFALCERHTMHGEIRDLEEAGRHAREAFQGVIPGGMFAEGSAAHGLLLFLRAHLKLVWYNYHDRKDPADLDHAIADLERAVLALGQTPELDTMVSSDLWTARALRELLTNGGQATVGPAARDAFDGLLAQARHLGPDHPEYPAVLALAAGGLVLRGLADNNLKLLDQAITLLGDACAAPNLAVKERPRLLATHGFALLTRHFRRNSQRDLSNAIGRLEEARRAVDQEAGSPYATTVLLQLAMAYRTRADAARGDVDRAVTYGLAGLREHAGDVLLQGSDDQALYAARSARDTATEMVGWFLDHGRPAAAVGAIELSRGTVLHAATTGARVEEALRLAGQDDLAAQWAVRAGGDPDPDLRYQVMLAIERSPAEAWLLSPPSVGAITEALTASGADALVYLLVGEDGAAGLAVLVDQDKVVRPLRLPGLFADRGNPAARFIQARRAADARGRELGDLIAQGNAGRAALAAASAADQEAARAWADTLGPLGEWTWSTAIRPVLDAVRGRGGQADPRIVLAPGGELGLIPWHAARDPGTGRYACQDAVLSYAVSARQFIDATRCAPRPWGARPVLISDEKQSDRTSAAGIRALHAEHYPAGAVYGYARARLPATVPGESVAGSAAVLDALPGSGLEGTSMLHLGCHGRATVPVLHSSIRLGGASLLQVADILVQARAWRSRQQAEVSTCGLVVLASCLSDVTDADYDEALTLATAFLSAGAGGVVAARWRVNTVATVLLMAMFHRHLNAGADPARALRAAQLWMLDPKRDIPGHWPRELRDLVEQADDPDSPDVPVLASPAAWAGFAYQGR
jgi:tetratricopeptide (TPR) repeat protein